ncbi:hypothetical protein WDZ92_19545 [Nostoc sp. NIES-2111]
MFARLFSLSVLSALLLVMAPAEAGIVRVTAQHEDLTDIAPAADRWAAHYEVTLESRLPAFYLLSLLFDPQRYADLKLRPLVRTNIDGLVIQPDPALAADGLVQITALQDLSLGDVFDFYVEYVRSGPFAPGQPFEVLDSGFEFVTAGQVLDAGEPSAQLPEAGGLALAAAALAVMFGVSMRCRRDL